MQTPLVSVIIPNYNHAKYLKSRIDSVLNQTFSNFEVILMDDCSTDDSRTVLESYRHHPKVTHVIFNQQNSGSTFYQWNKGIAVAAGKYIWIAESDDLSDSNLLKTLIAGIQQVPNIVLAYCQSLRINSQGESIGDWFFQTDDLDKQLFESDFVIDGKTYIDRFLMVRNTIPNASAVLFNKEAYLQCGGADPNIKYCSDWLTWIKLLHYGNVFYTSRMLNQFRYHQSSVIATSGSRVDFFKEFDLIMRFAYKKLLKEKLPYDKRLYKKNLSWIRKEARIEFKFHLKNKNLMKALPYLKTAAFTF